MSMITMGALNTAAIYIGPAKLLVRGQAEDFFTISPTSDRGGGTDGIGGDTSLWTRANNGYSMAVTCFQESAAVDLILGLGENLTAPIPIAVNYGRFSMLGVCVIQNEGEWVAGVGGRTRTITLRLARQSGNKNAGVGTVFQLQ
jgi:hypothetical protein